MDNSSSQRKRRTNGQGTVYLRADGRWCAQFHERDSLGTTKKRTLYAKTEHEAHRKLSEALPANIRTLPGLRRTGEPLSDGRHSSHVYVVQCEHGGPIKIGVAKDVATRLSAIQSCCPYPLSVLYIIKNGGQDVERRLHRNLRHFRVHGEWFQDHELVHYWIAEMKLLSDNRNLRT